MKKIRNLFAAMLIGAMAITGLTAMPVDARGQDRATVRVQVRYTNIGNNTCAWQVGVLAGQAFRPLAGGSVRHRGAAQRRHVTRSAAHKALDGITPVLAKRYGVLVSVAPPRGRC